MGGTTAKASLIETGQLTHTDEYEVGGGISLSSRLVKGGGHALKLPVIDISEVGAGGGSKVWFDKGGALKVGPESAGASPGPACYGAGGHDATVTDANVVLGYLNPAALAGGTVPIDASLARAIVETDVANRLGVTVAEAAWWISVVATANMVRAVKAVSTYRGRNPADFVLIAFGGNGGIFASELLRQLQMTRALVPPAAGVFSAVGLCVSDVQFSRRRAFRQPLSQLDTAQMRSVLEAVSEAAAYKLGTRTSARILRRAAMRYVGQGFELAVPIGDLAFQADTAQFLRQEFETEYARTYGHHLSAQYEVEIVALDVTAFMDAERRDGFLAKSGRCIHDASPKVRRAYFGPEQGWRDTPVSDRRSLGTDNRPGPWIIEEYEGTTVVPPNATVHVDDHGNLVIELNTESCQ
jgi:N-methylhydantoinase A